MSNIREVTVREESFGDNEYLLISKSGGKIGITEAGKDELAILDKMILKAQVIFKIKEERGYKLSAYERAILELDKTE